MTTPTRSTQDSHSPARVGLVDLDASHPGAFTPLLRDMGLDVVGVWHHGPAGRFARTHDIPRVYDDLDDPALAYDGPAFAAAYRAARR